MDGYGTAQSGSGYNEESLDYKRNPTIENYLRLRRADPEAEVEVAVTGGIDQLFYMEPELRKFGFDPQMVAGVLDANSEDIQQVSLQIMEKMIEARRRRADGETHLASRGEVIPDKLIDWLICCALDAMSWNDYLHIPRDLIVLIRERLGGANREYEVGAKVHEKRQNAAMVAGQLIAQGINPTFRMLAQIFNVAPSTVKRWFPNGEFLSEANVYATWFDENGKLRPLLPKRGLRTKQRAQRKSD